MSTTLKEKLFQELDLLDLVLGNENKEIVKDWICTYVDATLKGPEYDSKGIDVLFNTKSLGEFENVFHKWVTYLDNTNAPVGILDSLELLKDAEFRNVCDRWYELHHGLQGVLFSTQIIQMVSFGLIEIPIQKIYDKLLTSKE